MNTEPLLPAFPALYTMNEAAEVMRCHRKTLYTLARRGKLRLVKVGTRTVVRRDDLEALIVASVAGED